MFQRQENGFTGRAAQGSEVLEGRLREQSPSETQLQRGFFRGGGLALNLV